ncbi:unnamed protein product [Brugia pahangi]|uniref:C-type lectin domain-containing protein n=1 Tax=Brugia pahangi TaxID=6280 RepID=A0A0N4SXK6_BRUPA|nr:unnamed protein product [Brugia pahangi]
MVLNGTQQVYAWNRNIYTKNFFSISSFFVLWKLHRIDVPRPINKEMDELGRAQCMCHNGYHGSFCDQSFNIFGIAFESQSIICTDNQFEFSCPSEGIRGKMLNFHIEKLNVTYWEQCVHPSSLQAMINSVKVSLLAESMIFSHCFQIVLVYLAQLLVCSIGCDVCLCNLTKKLKFVSYLSYSAYAYIIFLEPMTICPSHAVCQNGRTVLCPICNRRTTFNIQCANKMVDIGFFGWSNSRKKIAIVCKDKFIIIKVLVIGWMDGFERLGGSSFCDCYYITSRRAFWNQRNCNSSQQWVYQFEPETQSTEVHNKFMKQHIIFNRLWNVEWFEWKVQQYYLLQKIAIYQNLNNLNQT